MNLEKSLAEAKLAVHYFFDNKFDEAKQLLQPWFVYHTIQPHFHCNQNQTDLSL